MKVLQINSVCGIGSTGRMTIDIHKLLIQKGYESYIAYGRDLPKNCDNKIRIGRKFDNYTHAIKTRIFDKHGFGSKKASLDFIEKIKDINPDIIHLHNIHGYYINIKILFDYIKASNKPIMWTLHDCWGFTGHCAHFDYIDCEKWKIGCYKCPQKREYPASFVFDNSKKNYLIKKDIFNGIKNLTFITPSEWLSTLVQQSFLNKYKVHTVHNGIDLSIFKPIENKFREKHNLEDKYIILGVSNVWNNRKGFSDYIKLSQNLKEDEMIILVGLTERQRNGLPKNILGITKTRNTEELVEIYSSADVFVNLTKEDNYPTVNLEAMACGTPVISYDTGGCKEIITEKNGYIVEKSNLKEIIKTINLVKEKKTRLSVEDFSKEIDKDILFKEYMRFYERYG